MKSVIFIGSILVGCSAFSAPARVIADMGQTKSIKRYLPTNPIQRIKKPVSLKSQAQFSFNSISPALSEGFVKTRHVNLKQIAMPIYIVGSDKTSIKWLAHYKPILLKLHAMGILVNTKPEDYKNFSQKTGLSLIPIDADLLAKRFGVTHYPVLISKHLIEQ